MLSLPYSIHFFKLIGFMLHLVILVMQPPTTATFYLESFGFARQFKLLAIKVILHDSELTKDLVSVSL